MSSTPTHTARRRKRSNAQWRLPKELKCALKYWYRLRFESQDATVSLLSKASEEQREVVSIVAMLDLEPQLLRSVMSPKEWRRVKACHHYLRQAHIDRLS